MATVKLSEKALVTALNDADTIVVVDKDNKVVRTTVANFETARAATIATKVMEQMTSGITVKGGEYGVAQDGMRYSPEKAIGNSANGEATAVLIAPFTNIGGTREAWRGCIGRFTFVRGASGYGLHSSYADVVLAKAYETAGGNVNSTWSGVKVGYCTYSGQMYLALYLPSAAANDVSFSGKFSGNCVFTPVKYSAVSGWTDL